LTIYISGRDISAEQAQSDKGRGKRAGRGGERRGGDGNPPKSPHSRPAFPSSSLPFR